MGTSGSGKTSLLRALGGLWNAGAGDVSLAADVGGDGATPQRLSPRDVFFVPQKPYLVLGSLRQQLLYPMWAATPSAPSAFEDAEAAAAAVPASGALRRRKWEDAEAVN